MIVRNVKEVPEFLGHDGTVKIRPLLEKKDIKSDLLFFNENYVDPGVEVSAHTHHNEEEIYYILEGRALMKVDEEEMEVGKGHIVLTPKGGTHTIKNVGDKELRFLSFAVRVG